MPSLRAQRSNPVALMCASKGHWIASLRSQRRVSMQNNVQNLDAVALINVLFILQKNAIIVIFTLQF